jgi:hypothetical protein
MGLGAGKTYDWMMGKTGVQTGVPGLTGSATADLSQWMNYDPSKGAVTGMNALGGQGPSAILDALARNSYQNLQTSVNDQAQAGNNRVIDALAKRGLMRSSQAPAQLSLLEGQRLKSTAQGARDIEGMRLQGQMNIPGQMMGIGSWGQSMQNQQNQTRQGMMSQAMNWAVQREQARQAQQEMDQQAQGAQLAAMGQLGSGIGSIAGFALGGPVGAMAGEALGNMIGGMQARSPGGQRAGRSLGNYSMGSPNMNMNGLYNGPSTPWPGANNTPGAEETVNWDYAPPSNFMWGY